MVDKYSIDKETITNTITNILTKNYHTKEIKLQDRFTITNKSYMLNRDIIQTKIDYITQPIPKLTQITKSVVTNSEVIKVVDKNIYNTNTLLQNRTIKELKLQDRSTMANHTHILESNNIKNLKDVIDQAQVLINTPKHTTPKDTKELGLINIPKIKSNQKPSRTINNEMIMNSKYKDRLSPVMEIEVEKSVDKRLDTLGEVFNRDIINIMDDLEVDIDYLATRIFNELKDELEMEYR